MKFQTPALANIRVLDLSRLLPGPYATRLLSDLGAEVIKIETPRIGDYARMAPAALGGRTMFEMLNRDKKSLALNYRNEDGRGIFLKLAETADVIIETFKPGSVEKWGIGYKAVQQRNPDIIYCSLSGYGQSGPYATRPGHDLNYIAIGGFLNINGNNSSPPAFPGVQIADLSGGTFAVINILAALLSRQITGQGIYLDVAMLDPIVHWVLSIAGSQYQGTGEIPQRGSMPLSGGWPCYNVYSTQDGRYLALGALEPPFWIEFCKLTDRNDLLADAFNREVIPELALIFGSKNSDDWLKLFEGAECPIDLVLDLPETLQHPQVIHRGFGSSSSTKAGQAARSKSLPHPYPADTKKALALGGDTHAILESIGYSQEEISRLADKKVIKISD